VGTAGKLRGYDDAADSHNGGFPEMILTRRFRPEWILAVVALAAAAWAQQQDPNQPQRDTRERQQDEEEPVFVFEITPQLLYNGLDKLVEKRLAKDYDLDEYQCEEMRQLLHRHVPKFLREHREELQSLWVEWTEAISGQEPPDPEYVADWASRFLPVVEEAKGMVDSMSEDMREFLDDRQQVLLDGYLAAINVGMRPLTNRLHVFKEGGFEPERDWPGYQHVRHREPEEMRQLRKKMDRARNHAMMRSRSAGDRSGPSAAGASDPELVEHVETAKPKPTTQPSKGDWERYVEDFIRRYQLNDEQKQKAYSFLKQQTAQRDEHLLRKAPEIERITKMFNNAGGDKKKIALAEARRQKLDQPIDRMFEKLKQKLETLPTREQRKAAAMAASKKPKPPQSAPARAAKKRRP
jgi:hypothetical protein